MYESSKSPYAVKQPITIRKAYTKALVLYSHTLL